MVGPSTRKRGMLPRYVVTSRPLLRFCLIILQLLAALGRRQLSHEQHGLLLDIDPGAVSEKDRLWLTSLFNSVAKELAGRNGDSHLNGTEPVVKMDIDGATDKIELTRVVPADAPSWLTTVLRTALGEVSILLVYFSLLPL